MSWEEFADNEAVRLENGVAIFRKEDNEDSPYENAKYFVEEAERRGFNVNWTWEKVDGKIVHTVWEYK